MNNRTYSNCKLLITANRYTYNDMYAKLDLFLLMGRITEDEYIELTGMLVATEPPTEPEPVPEPEVPVSEPEVPAAGEEKTV